MAFVAKVAVKFKAVERSAIVFIYRDTHHPRTVFDSATPLYGFFQDAREMTTVNATDADAGWALSDPYNSHDVELYLANTLGKRSFHQECIKIVIVMQSIYK